MMKTNLVTKTLFAMVFLLLFSTVSFAQYSVANSSGGAPDKFTGTLTVNKTGPENASLTETITITIDIENPGSASTNAYVVEYLGNVVPVDPIPTMSNISNESMLAASPPMLVWNVTVPAGGTASVNYKIKPKTVGVLSIGPTQVIVSGAKFFSKSLQVNIACTAASSCNETAGETPLTCPAKCGLNASETAPSAPNLTEIATAEYKPVSDPKSVPLDQSKVDEINRILMIIGIVILLIVAGAAYMLFLRKK